MKVGKELRSGGVRGPVRNLCRYRPTPTGGRRWFDGVTAVARLLIAQRFGADKQKWEIGEENHPSFVNFSRQKGDRKVWGIGLSSRSQVQRTRGRTDQDSNAQ